MVKILACDPASTFGWAVIDNGTYIAGGAETFKHHTPAAIRKGGHRGKKWGSFIEWFRSLVDEHQPDLIVYERVRRNASTLAAHAYGFFRYSIEATAFSSDIPIYPMDVGSWKKYVTSAGNSSKGNAALSISKIFPDVEFVTEDHSDALSIGYALQEMYKTDAALLDTLWMNNNGKRKKKAKKDDDDV